MLDGYDLVNETFIFYASDFSLVCVRISFVAFAIFDKVDVNQSHYFKDEYLIQVY